MAAPKYLSENVVLGAEQTEYLKRLYGEFLKQALQAKGLYRPAVFEDEREVQSQISAGLKIRLGFAQIFVDYLQNIPSDSVIGYKDLLTGFMNQKQQQVLEIIQTEERMGVYQNFVKRLLINLQGLAAKITDESDDYEVRYYFIATLLNYMNPKNFVDGNYPPNTGLVDGATNSVGYYLMVEPKQDADSKPDEVLYGFPTRIADDIALLLYLAKRDFDIDLKGDLYAQLRDLYSIAPTAQRFHQYLVEPEAFLMDIEQQTLPNFRGEVTLEMRLEKIKSDLINSLGTAKKAELEVKATEYFEGLCAMYDGIRFEDKMLESFMGGGRKR